MESVMENRCLECHSRVVMLQASHQGVETLGKGRRQLPSETSRSTRVVIVVSSCLVVLGHKMETQEILETKKQDMSPVTRGSCATEVAEELSALEEVKIV
jgi:hypothetical protein